MKKLNKKSLAGLLVLTLAAIVPLGASAATNVPKFAEIKDTKLKKQTFFKFLAPIVEQINQDLLKKRAKIVALHKEQLRNKTLSSSDTAWIRQTAKNYRVYKFDPHSERKWNELVRRVDIVPVSLVLAQAANESAWGTSRFARDGNNYFGQWCFKRGCGIVPKNRGAGQKHEIQSFVSVKAAIESYMHNLNTHLAYKTLREKRNALRSAEQKIQGVVLANGLVRYSDRGHAYVRAIQRLIKNNQLDHYQTYI